MSADCTPHRNALPRRGGPRPADVQGFVGDDPDVRADRTLGDQVVVVHLRLAQVLGVVQVVAVDLYDPISPYGLLRARSSTRSGWG